MECEDNGYPYKLNGLAPLHRSMRERGASSAAFPFEFGRVACSALFFTDESPYKLVFYKHASSERLEFEVLRGYLIRLPRSREDEIASFFEISGRGFRWHLFNRLVEAINGQAPGEFRPPRPTERRAIAVARQLEEADKIYFCGFRDWSEINARATGRICHRSDENLKKVKLLDRRMYEDIKGRDISVCYTSDPAKAKTWSPSKG